MFSDRPPPADIADKDILKKPAGTAARTPETTATGPVAAASAARPAASGPRISGKDAQLDAKKKEAEAQEAARQKAEEERVKQAQAEGCARARQAKAGIDSGLRIQTTNEKGERDFMTDEARAAEARRLQGVLKDCS